YDATTKLYGNGTGIEAFSFIPRLTLPVVRDQAEGTTQIFGVDGPAALGEAFFTGDSQWHTVAIGGLREGGSKLGGGRTLQPESGGAGSEPMRSGYYALDLTQPDPLKTITDTKGQIVAFAPDIPGGAGNVPPAPATALPVCPSS